MLVAKITKTPKNKSSSLPVRKILLFTQINGRRRLKVEKKYLGISLDRIFPALPRKRR